MAKPTKSLELHCPMIQFLIYIYIYIYIYNSKLRYVIYKLRIIYDIYTYDIFNNYSTRARWI